MDVCTSKKLSKNQCFKQEVSPPPLKPVSLKKTESVNGTLIQFINEKEGLLNKEELVCTKIMII